MTTITVTGRVLITTPYLHPDGEVDRFLREAGCRTVFARAEDRERTGRSLAETLSSLGSDGGVDAIVAGTDAFDEAVLGEADRLRVIARCGVGYDNVDVQAASRLGAAVTITPGANGRSVAELVLGLILSCARGIPGNVEQVRSGRWVRTSGTEIEGATLGVVGFGSIGRTVARLAAALGMLVLGHDPLLSDSEFDRVGVQRLGLADVLARSDFVSLHLPLTESTRGLIDAEALRSMKPTAFLINTARGEVVDERALASALRAKTLAGAALDVVEQEPLPDDSPLRGIEELLVTAHIGAATTQARSRSSMQAAAQVVDALAGNRPEHCVNPEVFSAVAR